jgi:CRISPR/Cas system Type II protein with McrA/HNH and RuvC-like nuclease domain
MSKSISTIINLYDKQKGLCEYCKNSLINELKNNKLIHIDHMKPKSDHGKNDIKNLCLVCRSCNSMKHTKTAEEFRIYIQPYLDGKVDKKDLRDYYIYEKLKIKFNNKE